MVSYEAALGLSVVAVVLVAGTLTTNGIVRPRRRTWVEPVGVTGGVPFVIFLIAGTAELNRPPFDLVEAEQELVAATTPSTAVGSRSLPGRVPEHRSRWRPSS